jgi:hypothetical protein
MPKFKSRSDNQSLGFLLQDHPPVQRSMGLLDGINGISQIASAGGNSSIFGFKGKSFVSEIGNILPTNTTIANESYQNKTGSKTIGQKIVAISNSAVAFSNDSNSNNNSTDFISLKQPDPTFRPVGIRFNQDHTALYITSMGKEEIRKTSPTTGYSLSKPTPWFYQHTGVVWKVTNSSAVIGLAASQPPSLEPQSTRKSCI